MARPIWDRDEDRDEQDEFEQMAMCPMGVSCVGGLFSFFVGWCVEMITKSLPGTLFAMAAAGAFGIASGLQGSDPLKMKRIDYIMMFIAIYGLVNVMNVFVPCTSMETILLVSMSSSTAAGSLRPIILIPMTISLDLMEKAGLGGSKMKDMLPSKNTC